MAGVMLCHKITLIDKMTGVVKGNKITPVDNMACVTLEPLMPTYCAPIYEPAVTLVDLTSSTVYQQATLMSHGFSSVAGQIEKN